MFKFLRRTPEAPPPPPPRDLLADIRSEFERQATASHVLFNPADTAAREELLLKATAAGFQENEAVKRLAFLGRLVAFGEGATSGKWNAGTAARLLSEAAACGAEETSAARWIRSNLELERFEQYGPDEIARDEQDRAVYLQCNAQFKNKSGRLEARKDGLTFVGEVRVDIDWATVSHVAETEHSYRGDEFPAIDLQENQRRTPTKFVFCGTYAEATHAIKVIQRLWTQRDQVTSS